MRFLTADFLLRFFPVQVIRRFYHDKGLRHSAALAFSSLLALAPLLAIIFSVLSLFTGFSDLGSNVEEFVFQNLVPSVSDDIRAYLQTFAERAGKMTAISVFVFFITTLILLNNIETSLNEIWRSSNKRSVLQRLLIYWAMVTLGPILMGASLSLSTYLLSIEMFNSLDSHIMLGALSLELLPMLFELLAFFLLYTIMPNTTIKWRFSLAGAAVATLLFECSKWGFSSFIKNFSNYELIYGAFASLPIFLIWIYLSWIVIFIGAEVVAVLGLCDKAESIEQLPKQPPIMAESRKEKDSAN